MDLLVIDDMAAVKVTPWVLQELYLIINRRYNERRSIVITTDLSRDELANTVGWRVVSRLAECTGKAVIFRDRITALRAEATLSQAWSPRLYEARAVRRPPFGATSRLRPRMRPARCQNAVQCPFEFAVMGDCLLAAAPEAGQARGQPPR